MSIRFKQKAVMQQELREAVRAAHGAPSPEAAVAALAQQATFRSATSIVPVLTTVLDKSGRLVPDLEREDFTVLDNGKPQEVVFFQNDVQPFTVVVMMDFSFSMNANLKLLKAAAEQFILRLLPDDRAQVGAFSDKIMFSGTFTSDRDELIAAGVAPENADELMRMKLAFAFGHIRPSDELVQPVYIERDAVEIRNNVFVRRLPGFELRWVWYLTVLSITLSLVAVFLPILLMGGMMGRIFREFAVTLSVAILVSLVVSLTTTPMMCAKLLRREAGRSHGRWYRITERVFESMRGGYAGSLTWVLRHPRIMLAVTLATMGLSVYLYTIVPKGFFPQQDTGRISASIQAAQDISFQAMRQKLTDITEIIRSDPAVESVTAFSGGGTYNVGRSMISLKPLAEREITTDEVIARLRPKLAKVPGAATKWSRPTANDSARTTSLAPTAAPRPEPMRR